MTIDWNDPKWRAGTCAACGRGIPSDAAVAASKGDIEGGMCWDSFDCDLFVAERTITELRAALEAETRRALAAEAERDTWRETATALRTAEALVSGALADAGSVIVDPPHRGIRMLAAERDAMRAERDALKAQLVGVLT